MRPDAQSRSSSSPRVDGYMPPTGRPRADYEPSVLPRPDMRQRQPAEQVVHPVENMDALPLVPELREQPAKSKKPRRTNGVLNFFAVLLGMAIVFGAVGTWWYKDQLAPVNSANSSAIDVVIEDGATITTVLAHLEQKGLIKNAQAMQLYLKLHPGMVGELQQGTCRASPSEDPVQIVQKVAKGCHDFKAVTFYPGATIEKPIYKPADAQISQTMYVKYVLEQAGYTGEEIAAALAKQYTGPLFDGKPAGSTLEGYIFGETYHVATDMPADKLLQTTFDQMYKEISEAQVLPKYKAQNLTLFQAITLASIVQRELNCEDKPTAERKNRCYEYQRTIAQVFLKRLKDGTTLGSDVTFIYAADMKNVTPSPDLDSPYNTRKNSGLPPGPIAVPGVLALKAVANPTPTDFVYFIAGDDGLIYFAKTDAEHQQNIKNHCQKLCSEL